MQKKSGCGLGLGELLKIFVFPIIFLQRLKLATSKLARGWVFYKTVNIVLHGGSFLIFTQTWDSSPQSWNFFSDIFWPKFGKSLTKNRKGTDYISYGLYSRKNPQCKRFQQLGGICLGSGALRPEIRAPSFAQFWWKWHDALYPNQTHL